MSKWIGHSITVSGRHYANDVPDVLFDQAAATASGQAQRNAQRKGHEKGRNARKHKNAISVTVDDNSLDFQDLRKSSETRKSLENWRRGESHTAFPCSIIIDSEPESRILRD